MSLFNKISGYAKERYNSYQEDPKGMKHGKRNYKDVDFCIKLVYKKASECRKNDILT